MALVATSTYSPSRSMETITISALIFGFVTLPSAESVDKNLLLTIY